MSTFHYCFLFIFSCNSIGTDVVAVGHHCHHTNSYKGVILDFFWWWLRQKGPGPSPRRRYQQQQQEKSQHRHRSKIQRSIGTSHHNNNNDENNMLGAAQDQLAPIRLSGHTLDKATKAKVKSELALKLMYIYC